MNNKQYKFIKDYVYADCTTSCACLYLPWDRVFKKGKLVRYSTLSILNLCPEVLLQHGFIEEVKDEYDEWEEKGIKSKLANVIIAPEDYVEEGKKYFTWDEAMKIKDKLNNGWRLPTRKEWALICEEFACNSKGNLSPTKLMHRLGLTMNGWKNKCGSLRSVGDDGFYWSGTAYPGVNNAYYLNFNSATTYPSNYDARWFGFSVRLVKSV